MGGLSDSCSEPEKPTSTGRRRDIPTLDGWRAIAILMVLAHHAGTAYFSESAYYIKSPTRFGTLGVPIFFGLSGLLICKLLLEEFDATGTLNLKAFYIRRGFRILPALFAVLAACAALGLLRSRTELLGSLFFVRNYIPDSISGPFTGHLWSLSVEEHFYIIWPALLCFLLSTKRALAGTILLALGFSLWRVFDFHVHLIARMAPFLNTPMRSDLRLDGLFWGCVCAFLLHRSRNVLFRYYRFGVFVLGVSAFVICLVRPVPLGVVWTAMLIPLMMLGTAAHPEWRLSRFLDLQPLRWIGKISYSLYLWQQLFLVPSWEPHPLASVQRFPWNVMLIIACATSSYYIMEKPLLRIGRSISSRMQAGNKSFRVSTARSHAVRLRADEFHHKTPEIGTKPY